MDKNYRRPTEQDIDLLMFHLLRVPQVIQAALPMLEVEHFTPVVERQEALLWAISRDYFKAYNAAIKVCAEAGDNGSRDLFLALLKDEEGHVDWLETQTDLVGQMSLAQYLSTQV